MRPVQAQPGWYADPAGSHQFRYWDGTQWTAQVGDNGKYSRDALPRSGRLARLPGIASLPRRGLASLIDLIPLGIVNLSIYVFWGRGIVQITIAVAVGAAYLVPLIAIYGQTLGDRAVGIQVVSREVGAVPGWRRSILRYFVFDGIDLVVGAIFPVAAGWVTIIVVGAAIFDKSRQGLHDRAAGVLVVEVPPHRP